MAIPTEKSAGIERAIDSTLEGINPDSKGRRRSISADVCAWCNGPATEFKDELSEKEYRISGLCQKCQEKVFE